MYENIKEDVLALDFAVRQLARTAKVDLSQDQEPALRQALAELDPGSPATLDDRLIRANEESLLGVAAALRDSPEPRQSQLYQASLEKAQTGRLFSVTAITIGVSAALVIIALRIGTLEVLPDGKGLKVSFRPNTEPLSASLRAVSELIQRLFGGIAMPPASERDPGDDTRK